MQLERMNPIMYAGMEPGGQLTTTTEVDNFPNYQMVLMAQP
jgi:thioredoxin reductase